MASVTKKATNSSNHGKLPDEIAEALQCPVCYEMPRPPIHQCERGHHLCGDCRHKLPTCPLCKGRFSGARNYLAEELVLKVQALSDRPGRQKKNTHAAQSGRHNSKYDRNIFRCLISNCNEDGLNSSKAMTTHVRQCHSDILHEVRGVISTSYTQAWELTYEGDQKYQSIHNLSRMGLFVFTLDVKSNGDLFAWVQMVALPEVASQHKYKIKIFDTSAYKRKTSFTDEVASSLDSWRDIIGSHRCLAVSWRDMKHFTWDCDSFGCLISISRVEEGDSDSEDIDNLCEAMSNCLRSDNQSTDSTSIVDEEHESQTSEGNNFHYRAPRDNYRGRPARPYNSRGRRYPGRYRRGDFNSSPHSHRGNFEGQGHRQRARQRYRSPQRNQYNFPPRNQNHSPRPLRRQYYNRPYNTWRNRRSYRNDSPHSYRSSSPCSIDDMWCDYHYIYM